MKIKFSNVIPFNGFFAINLFGVMFVRKKYESYFGDKATKEQKEYVRTTVNHESIHTAQMKELLYVGFYIWYFIEWLVKIVVSMFCTTSPYYSISFEQEAYGNEEDDEYLNERKHYSWMKYVFKMSDKY